MEKKPTVPQSDKFIALNTTVPRVRGEEFRYARSLLARTGQKASPVKIDVSSCDILSLPNPFVQSELVYLDMMISKAITPDGTVVGIIQECGMRSAHQNPKESKGMTEDSADIFDSKQAAFLRPVAVALDEAKAYLQLERPLFGNARIYSMPRKDFDGIYQLNAA
jgi:hypothetical protein